jgi:hypothetical protein
VTQVLAVALAIDLLAFAGAHLSLLGSLIARPPRYRGFVALLVPPLAPYWGWQDGIKARVFVWTAALGLYATGVAVLAFSQSPR